MSINLTTRIHLTTRRSEPPARRQDGFAPTRPEARYDLVHTTTMPTYAIPPGVVQWGDRVFRDTGEHYADGGRVYTEDMMLVLPVEPPDTGTVPRSWAVQYTKPNSVMVHTHSNRWPTRGQAEAAARQLHSWGVVNNIEVVPRHDQPTEPSPMAQATAEVVADTLGKAATDPGTARLAADLTN